MPYIKQQKQDFDKMARLLLGYGLTARKLAVVLGVSEPTAKKRLDRPDTLTLGELDRINRFAHVPYDEIRSAVSR